MTATKIRPTTPTAPLATVDPDPDKELYELLKSNIETALEDYSKHTYQQTVLEDVQPVFVRTLAQDCVSAKRDLRNMMRKSPAWNEELQCWIINGNRTHNTDWEKVKEYADQMLWKPLNLSVFGVLGPTMYRDFRENYTFEEMEEAKREVLAYTKLVNKAELWFCTPDANTEDREEYLQALKMLAPDAYHEGRRVSKIFRLFCQALGVLDETAGSDFQHYFALFADELSAKRIDFKLFVSINPAHFLTMSNPKEDRRGETLTSCHSFNNTEYEWNCGCTGYARDNVTMIAFTVDDPSNPELLNNRKTTRQLYMYEPGNGVLLQSRLYNTNGGTQYAQEETKVYRDLIEREISYCEEFDNLWDVKSSRETTDFVNTGRGFGGYKDWTYDYYDPHVCVQKDFARENSYHPITVGTYGLCVCCADEISEYMYCYDCREMLDEEDGHCCQVCGDWIEEYNLVDTDSDTYYDTGGDRLEYVCTYCAENSFYECPDCGDFHQTNRYGYPNSDNMIYVPSIDSYVCVDCVSDGDNYFCCECCGDYFSTDEIVYVYDKYGDENCICPACLERNYRQCPDCGAYIPNWYDETEMPTCPNCGVCLYETETEPETETETEPEEELEELEGPELPDSGIELITGSVIGIRTSGEYFTLDDDGNLVEVSEDEYWRIAGRELAEVAV